MAHALFTKDFNYKPKAAVTIAYKAGMELTVRRDCLDKAIAAGVAIDLDKTEEVDTDDGAAIEHSGGES